MAEPAFQPRSREGVAHLYAEKLIAFEHASSSSAPSKFPNLLLFIGGLGDNILTVPYPSLIASRLPPNWALVEVQISSSGTGFGTGSLKRDADEIAQCVRYFKGVRGEEAKIVLMGHSTGCQDVMQYLVGDANKGDGEEETRYEERERPRVQGAVLQAPVSDREGMATFGYEPEVLEKALDLAKTYVKEGRAEDVLPFEFTSPFYESTPVCARRFVSLALPGGDDDFFSSDLDDRMLEGTFGRIPEGTRLCVLYSGEDEYAMAVDKEKLVRRWRGVAENARGELDGRYSGVVQGASHSLKGDPESVVDDLVRRVVGFVEGC